MIPRGRAHFRPPKFSQKNVKKNFFNKSVNLNKKFSKKVDFFEKSQKSPSDYIWVIWKKVVFSLIFFVVWGIWYEKHMIFHEILRPQKVWFPGGGGTLLEFLSKKKGITVPHVRSKLCVFWNSHLKFFWLFFEKSRFLTFSYLWENQRKGT